MLQNSQGGALLLIGRVDYCDFCKAALCAEASYDQADADMRNGDYEEAADAYDTAAGFDPWGAGTIPKDWWADWAVAVLRSKQYGTLLERLETGTGDDSAQSWLLKSFALLGLGRASRATAAVEEALSHQESAGLRLVKGLLAEYVGQTISVPDPLVQVLGRNARMWEDCAERGNVAGDRVGSEIDRQLAILINTISRSTESSSPTASH